jgi:uncharacterized protein YukE
MSEEILVTPEVLRAYASTVDGIADRVAAALSFLSQDRTGEGVLGARSVASAYADLAAALHNANRQVASEIDTVAGGVRHVASAWESSEQALSSEIEGMQP